MKQYFKILFFLLFSVINNICVNSQNNSVDSSITFYEEILDSIKLDNSSFQIINRIAKIDTNNFFNSTSINVFIKSNNKNIGSILENNQLDIRNDQPNLGFYSCRKIQCFKVINNDEYFAHLFKIDYSPGAPGYDFFSFIKIKSASSFQTLDKNSINNQIFKIYGKLDIENNILKLENNRFEIAVDNHYFRVSVPVLLFSKKHYLTLDLDTTSLKTINQSYLFNIYNSQNYNPRVRSKIKLQVFEKPNLTDEQAIYIEIDENTEIKLIQGGIKIEDINTLPIDQILEKLSKIQWWLKIKINDKYYWIKGHENYSKIGIYAYG